MLIESKNFFKDEAIESTTFSNIIVNHRIKAISYNPSQAKYLLLPKLSISLIIIKGHCLSFQLGLVY